MKFRPQFETLETREVPSGTEVGPAPVNPTPPPSDPAPAQPANPTNPGGPTNPLPPG